MDEDKILKFDIKKKRKNISKKIDDDKGNSEKLLFEEINKIFKEVDNNKNELSYKVLDIYKNLSKKNKNIDKNFIELIQFIYSEAKKSKKDNMSERLKNFFDFFFSCDIKYEYLEIILKIKCGNFDIKNDKDIIYFWKKQILMEYIKNEFEDKNKNAEINNDISFSETEEFEKLFKLEKSNYNLNQIFQLFIYFNDIKEKKELFNSLLSTIKSYPGVDINNYKYFFENNKENPTDNQFALNFYLKISNMDSSKDKKLQEETKEDELYEEIKELNPNISDEKIKKIKNQIKQIKEVIKEKNFILDEQFHNWTINECSKMKFGKNIDSETAEVLGVISLAVYKENKYHLRNTQLIAILMFIYKEKNKGLIEEIVTGEGKSIIIASLSIYFALRKKYVDIITSGYTLAQRDSKKFSKLYGLFNLTTSYPRNYSSAPYEANILYGTFLEFEGDNLSELTSDEKIRNKMPRPYQVLIVDEVDNLFIDNILGSTRLTNSSKGFKYLIPYYFTTYLSVLLMDFFFKLRIKINLNLVKDENSKKNLSESIEDPKVRKNELIKIMEELMTEITYNKNIKIEEKTVKIIKEVPNFYEKIIKYIDYPNFLNNFVKKEESLWIDSAFCAQNEMFKDHEYVIAYNRSGHKDIAPVDRTNTGEIELSTVYDEGLHQMLEIKHRLRTREETVVHTFLSHITYFKKYYKENKEFLFFGMSGTLGTEETLDIYNTQFYSNILFIPPYKKKRFVILPTILCKKNEHYQAIYENIRLNYRKKRKILVICDSIMEANQIKEIICEQEKKNANNKDDNKENSNYGDMENDIILYTRSDKVKEDYLEKNSNKKIFLSTNLGGRGTDLKTNQEEENNGGLHVILTSMPKNFRVLKQAFGRTSREGKKGTGQMIIYNEKFNTYSEIVNEMNKREKERIENIEKQLDILLFKDNLFERFLGILKNKKINYKGYLIEEIKFRWANFLKINVTSNRDDLNKDKINKNFEEFKVGINTLFEEKNNIDEKFENKFYQMAEGINNNRNYKGNIMDYFMFSIDEKNEKFYFAQTYIKAIIRIVNTKNTEYNDIFFSDVLRNLENTQNRIKILIEECINPILYSFREWEQFTHNLIKFGDLEKYIQENPFENQNFEKTELFEQYSNIKNICMKIIKHIDNNILFINIYETNYRDNPGFSIYVKEQLLEDGLPLDEKEIKEKYFFSDSSFYYIYKFYKKKKEPTGKFLFFWNKIKMFLKFIATPLIYIINKIFNMNFQIIDNDNIELSRDTIFGNLFDIIKRKFKFILRRDNNENDKEEDDNIETIEDYDCDLSNIKDLLLNDILKNIDAKFNERVVEIENINFLIFIDFYLDEEIWKDRIKKIFSDNLIQYRQKIEEIRIKNEQFPKNSKDEKYTNYLDKYKQIFNLYLEKCLNEIKHLLDKKEYNRSTGLNCLEHLIKNLNPEAITEDIANKTVKKLIECNLISTKGILNKIFLKKNQKQYIKINININDTNNNNIAINDNNNNIIANLNDFYIDNINNNEIPKVNALFYDLSEVYEKENYNNLAKDYSLYIKNNFRNIVDKLLDFKDDDVKKFFEFVIKFIKAEIENLLRKNNFRKYYDKSMRNLISVNLSKKEKRILSDIMEETRKDIVDQFKDK